MYVCVCVWGTFPFWPTTGVYGIAYFWPFTRITRMGMCEMQIKQIVCLQFFAHIFFIFYFFYTRSMYGCEFVYAQ